MEVYKSINCIDQIIFVSKNAVRYFFTELKNSKLDFPDNILITCIGPGTANSLKQYNINPDFIPEINNSENLLELQNFKNVVKSKILLIKGEGGRTTIAQELIKRGANLTILDVYKRQLPNIDLDVINNIWQNNLIDIIIYTSKQAMINILELFPPPAKDWLLAKPCIVISQRLANHATNLGFKNVKHASYANILEAIKGLTL